MKSHVFECVLCFHLAEIREESASDRNTQKKILFSHCQLMSTLPELPAAMQTGNMDSSHPVFGVVLLSVSEPLCEMPQSINVLFLKCSTLSGGLQTCMGEVCLQGLQRLSGGEPLHKVNIVKGSILTCFLNLTEWLCCLNKCDRDGTKM